MKTVEDVWDQSPRNLAKACMEILSWHAGDGLPAAGVVDTFSENLRFEGFPSNQTLQLAENHVKTLALSFVVLRRM